MSRNYSYRSLPLPYLHNKTIMMYMLPLVYELLRYLTKSLSAYPPDSIVFYLPQIVQVSLSALSQALGTPLWLYKGIGSLPAACLQTVSIGLSSADVVFSFLRSVTPRALITESTNDSPSSRYGFPKNLVCRSSSVFISSDQWQRPSAWYLSWIEGQSGQLVLCRWEGILYWWVQSLPAIDWYFWRAERVWKEYQKEGNQEHSLCIFELSAFWLDSNWTPIFRQSISICLHNPSTVWFRSLWTLLLPCSPLRRLLICWCSRRCPGRDPKRDWRRSVLLMALKYIAVSPADR